MRKTSKAWFLRITDAPVGCVRRCVEAHVELLRVLLTMMMLIESDDGLLSDVEEHTVDSTCLVADSMVPVLL